MTFVGKVLACATGFKKLQHAHKPQTRFGQVRHQPSNRLCEATSLTGLFWLQLLQHKFLFALGLKYDSLLLYMFCSRRLPIQ